VVAGALSYIVVKGLLRLDVLSDVHSF